MRQFALETAASVDDALRLASAASEQESPQSTLYLAGGTNLLDLMKLDVMQPRRLIDISGLSRECSQVATDSAGLHLGALARMSDVADHPEVRRLYPVIADALWMAASPQLRNMATLGGNVLQRTRCNYFRDKKWQACNKRNPGSGCAAMEGANRRLAVLGVSDHCIASYPGDLANALIALNAQVHLSSADGASRTIALEELHRRPEDRPDLETNMRPGELITSFLVPAGPWTPRSLYLKVRDRQSYDFALASAAVALDLADGIVRGCRIGLGGVATVPWRARQAEAILEDQPFTEDLCRKAAEAAFADAMTHGDNKFKPELGRRTLVRALLAAAAKEVTDE